MRPLKNLIWLYFWLIIFEGAMRKWLFPGLSDVLLIVRDPLVLFIYWQAIKRGLFPKQPLVMAILTLAGISFAVGAISLLREEVSLPAMFVLMYGVRTFFLHLPLIFLMPSVLMMDDVLRFGRWCLLLAVPMTILMVAQYALPVDHWLNKTTMGEGTVQIGAALGRIRPPGTFSFITGPAALYPVIVAFLVYGILVPEMVSTRVRLLAGVAVLMALPISGSRTFVLACGVVASFTIIALIRLPGRSARFTWWAVITGAMGLMLLQLPIGQEAVRSFSTRWIEASDVEGQEGSSIDAIGSRVIGGFTEAISQIEEVPLMGHGIGRGTNVGSRLTTGSIFDFRFGESEWTRALMEMGPVMGLAYLCLRVVLCIYVLRFAWGRLVEGQPLAWLLASCCCIQLLNGQTGQPTAMGFMVFFAGLTLAVGYIPTRGQFPPDRCVVKIPVKCRIGRQE